ncbi:MAG TPA: hypothetical protein VJ352_13360 [Geodermatophilus sp.]|nr:hypothetical protein [Geodermatophilus sp.]
MTVPVDRPPTDVDEPPPAGKAPAERDKPDTTVARITEKLGIEDRSWLLFAVVVAFIVLAFAGMIVLTALAGGTDYVPWSDS